MSMRIGSHCVHDCEATADTFLSHSHNHEVLTSLLGNGDNYCMAGTKAVL